MAKYVIEIPDDQINDYIAPSNDMIFRIPVYKRNGTFSHFVQSDLSLTPYTEPDEQSVEKNAVNLCTSCKLFKEHFPECGDVNILFGDGVGNDNICCCNKYEPYTEPDRKAIEDEVWKFAWEILKLDLPVFRKIFGYDTDKMDYKDYKAKYEEWKKQKDEIRVGDEVEYKCDGIVRFVVFGIVGITAYGFKYPCDYDDVGEYCDIDMLTKTGRHFDEIDELLKKMKENENEIHS